MGLFFRQHRSRASNRKISQEFATSQTRAICDWRFYTWSSFRTIRIDPGSNAFCNLQTIKIVEVLQMRMASSSSLMEAFRLLTTSCTSLCVVKPECIFLCSDIRSRYFNRFSPILSEIFYYYGIIYHYCFRQKSTQALSIIPKTSHDVTKTSLQIRSFRTIWTDFGCTRLHWVFSYFGFTLFGSTRLQRVYSYYGFTVSHVLNSKTKNPTKMGQMYQLIFSNSVVGFFKNMLAALKCI